MGKRKLKTPVSQGPRKRRRLRPNAAPTPEQIIKCLKAVNIPKGSPGYISKVKVSCVIFDKKRPH